MAGEMAASCTPSLRVVAALVAEFGDLAPSLVEGCVAREVARFQNASVTGFVEILVHRAAQDRLRRGHEGACSLAHVVVARPVPDPGASGEVDARPGNRFGDGE